MGHYNKSARCTVLFPEEALFLVERVRLRTALLPRLFFELVSISLSTRSALLPSRATPDRVHLTTLGRNPDLLPTRAITNAPRRALLKSTTAMRR